MYYNMLVQRSYWKSTLDEFCKRMQYNIDNTLKFYLFKFRWINTEVVLDKYQSMCLKYYRNSNSCCLSSMHFELLNYTIQT